MQLLQVRQCQGMNCLQFTRSTHVLPPRLANSKAIRISKRLFRFKDDTKLHDHWSFRAKCQLNILERTESQAGVGKMLDCPNIYH